MISKKAKSMLRNILLLPLLTPLVLAQTGIVEGSVVNSTTRAGIEGVVVTLAGSDAIYKATTDASGAFHIADIQEGDYTPIFAKREFMSPPADHPLRKAI